MNTWRAGCTRSCTSASRGRAGETHKLKSRKGAPVRPYTYIRTRQGFLYLAFVLDLASRRVVGVSMASHMKAALVADALREAIGTRGGQVRGVLG